MALDAQHPQYVKFSDSQEQCVDTYAGEKQIKDKTTTYLPATSGQIADGQGTPNSLGQKAYNAYICRAVFPDVFKDSVNASIGIMHSKPPTIELPKKMESLLEKATIEGEGLELLLRKINQRQLMSGRVGLMLDLPSNPVSGFTLPYIAMYEAKDIINWNSSNGEGTTQQTLQLVVLDESEQVMDDEFQWKLESKFRVLTIVPKDAIGVKVPAGVYAQALFEGDNKTYDATQLEAPILQGTIIDFIPFTFINTLDLLTDPDHPPLLGVSNLALTIYRGEADYRQSLFMQGQDTLVVIGSVDEGGGDGQATKVGATAKISVPMGGDAKYIGVSSTGLSEQREALRNDRNDAKQLGGQLVDTASREREATDSLKIRAAANTATLNQIAQAGAAGLEQQLKYIATWAGLNPDEVSVTPNLDFAGDALSGKDLVDFMTAKNLGAPLSQETIHKIMQDTDVTELTLEEELSKISEEEPIGLGGEDNGVEDEVDSE